VWIGPGILVTSACSHAYAIRLFEQIDIQNLPTTIRTISVTLPRPRKNAAIIPFFSTLLIAFLKVL